MALSPGTMLSDRVTQRQNAYLSVWKLRHDCLYELRKSLVLLTTEDELLVLYKKKKKKKISATA